MRKGVAFLLFLVGSAAGASAQQPAATAPQNPTVPFASRGALGNLNDQQTLGLRLFNQSCQVCHTQATLNAALWGPALSQQSLGGDAAALHDKIANGSALMPAWKYKYDSTQIDAIVSYVKTMAPYTAPSRPVAAGPGNAD